MKNLPKVLQSSDGTGKLSTTIKGILVAVIPLVVNYTSLDENTVMQGIEALTAVIAGAVVIYGLFRKIQNRRLHG